MEERKSGPIYTVISEKGREVVLPEVLMFFLLSTCLSITS